MNILMVNPNVVVGGAQKIMLYLARGLERRGHRVLICTTSVDFDGLPPFARGLSYVVEDLPLLRRGGELANYTAIDNLPLLASRLWRLRRRIRRLIRTHRIDLVNPHNPPANWLCAGLPAPVVWSCHNNPMAFYRNWRAGYSPLWPSKAGLRHRVLEAGYEAADYGLVRFGIRRIVSLSEKIARGIRQVYHRDSDVITFALSDEDGILTGRVPPRTRRNGSEGWLMIQVGQLTEDKKPRVSLDVLERVRERIPGARLWFVGDGTLRRELEAEAERRRLSDRVRFLGYRGESELAEIYGEADVLLFPGGDQPLGLAPIEALWKSVVPIVSESSGVTDLLRRHGLTTVAPPTAEAFAEQVLAVYARRGELEPWLGRLKASLETELNYPTFIDRYVQCFERALHTA
jgi:glycosyltransferase involved in cell wall biosynthesis